MLAQVKRSGNVFAAFTPVPWPAGSPGYIADPSRRTCIVSLVNKHNRPFRLKLTASQEKYAISRNGSSGPRFGDGYDVGLLSHRGRNYCAPKSFELDAEAERKAGLPPLPFEYDEALLPGADDGKGVWSSDFSLAELECYTLDA